MNETNVKYEVATRHRFENLLFS